MSVTLLGTEGFFTRGGAWIGEYNRVAALYGSALDTGFQSIWNQYVSSDQAAVQTLPDAVTAFRASSVTYQNALAADAQSSVVLQVKRDTSVVPETLARAFSIIYTQMKAANASINRPTLTATVAYGSGNLGDTKFALSTTNIYGDPLDMTLSEVFSATCTEQGSGFDSTFSAVGEPAVATTQWDWPQGSGARQTVAVVDPAVDGIVTNGAFSSFTVANKPDDWDIVNGAAGVTVFQSVAGGVRSGTDAVYLQSDGSSATKLEQELSLSVNTVYAVTFQAKMNTNSASGTLVVQFTDAAGTVLTNDAGDDLEASYALNGGAGEITTSYQLLTVFFATPRQIPATGIFLRAGYGTAGVSTRQLFLDLVQVFAATPLYGLTGTGTSGPFVAGVANTVVSAVGDTATFTFTNSLGTQSFALGLERVYGLRGQGVYVPSSTSPTVADSLVTH